MAGYSTRILRANFFGPVVTVCCQMGHLPVQTASIFMGGHWWKMKSQPMRK